MKNYKKNMAILLAISMLFGSLEGGVIYALDNKTSSNKLDIDETNNGEIITTMNSNQLEQQKILFKEKKIAPEKPYVTSISSSSVSIGNSYKATYSIKGQARKGSTVYIKFGNQESTYVVGDDQLFGFNISTISRDIEVELYTVNSKGQKSDSTFVRLTSEGSYITNNGTVPTPNTVPEIIANDITIRPNTLFNPLDYVKAEDKEDGNITSKIIVKENTVNTSKEGTYKVVYTVTDSDENIAIKEIKVTVSSSNEKPIINVNDVTLRVGDTFNPLDYVKAEDKEDGNITSKIIVKENTVNTSKEGTYKVVYTVTDSDENTVTKEIKVTVKSNEKPVINASDVEIKVGDTFNALSVVNASDKEDGNITSKIIVKENTVNTSKEGTYKVVYTVTDSDENTVTKEIKVTVKSNEKPVINVNLSDIKGHWAESQINEFISNGHINGYNDGTFKPNNSITRAEFVKIFNKYFGLTKTSGKVFNDTKNHWAKIEIDIAVTNGVCNGVSETEFRPNDPITREQAAKMISNYMKLDDSNHDKLDKYSDKNKVSSWALNSVEGIIEKGYMNGYEDKTFRPNNSITRAEAVVTLSRVK